jgi:hypothetical protein
MTDSKALAFPRTVSQLVAQRKTKPRIDADHCEPFVLAVWESQDMQKFTLAIEQGETVEGSPRSDDQEMARIIRDYALSKGDTEVGHWNLDRIRHAAWVAIRRFAIRRIRGQSASHRNGAGNDSDEE